MKEIKVGAHKYTIHLSPTDSEGTCGETDFVKSTILINPHMSQSMKESTLIHEILHACNTTFSDEHLAHSVLDSMADQLYQVLSDNGLLNKKAFETLLGVHN